MYEPQHLFDLQDSLGNGGSDPKSWLSGSDDHRNGSSPSMLQRTHSSLSNASASANVDRVLYNEIAEILPLIQTLIVSTRLYIYLFLASKRELFL